MPETWIFKGVLPHNIMAKLTEVKGLKELKPKTKKQYDDLINQVRTQTGVPLNRSMLSDISVEAYVKKHKKPNGGYDLIGMAQPYTEVLREKKARSETVKLTKKLEKLKERQKNIELLLAKK